MAKLNDTQIYGDLLVTRNVVSPISQYFEATSVVHSSTSDYTLDLDYNQVHILTAEESFTIDVTNIRNGCTYILILKQDGTGSRSISWSSSFDWSGGVAPTLSSGADEVDVLTFIGGNETLYGVASLDFS